MITTISPSYTAFKDLFVFTLNSFTDDRGFFREVSNQEVFDLVLPKNIPFVQDNESFTKKNVLRGLHFQRQPHAQGKLVRVISGKVQDIVVDLRPESSTFKKYFEVILDGSNMMYVPPGFAHGFLALEDSFFHYKCTNFYNPQSEGGILWNDTDLNLPWKIKNPQVSSRDQKWLNLSNTVL